MNIRKSKMDELRSIISRMPLDVCCTMVLPDFGVRWADVAQAVRKARLPMIPASVARVIHRHVAKQLEEEELEDILAMLRLKMVATQSRTWHVIDLVEPLSDETDHELTSKIPSRVFEAMTKAKNKKNLTPELHSVKVGALLYLSVRFVSGDKCGTPLYVAVPPGQPVALTSSFHAGLLKIVVQGLGYSSYQDAGLNGRDVASLLRVHDPGHVGHAAHLAAPPEYRPVPVVTATGVDYTARAYNESYVREVLGPNPPRLSNLTMQCSGAFVDPTRLNKKMSLTMTIKSADVAQTLAALVAGGALAPTSPLLHLFHTIKSNRIRGDDSDDSDHSDHSGRRD